MISFDRPLTCLVTRGDARDSSFTADRSRILDSVSAAVEAGVSLIQIREKHLSTRNLFDLVADAAKVTFGKSRLLVNDRTDVAIAVGADGVQLRSDSIPVNIIRKYVRTNFVIGVSTHAPFEVLAARDGGADFALFGPVFMTRGKEDAAGLSVLRSIVAASSPFPVIAIGGIDADVVSSVMETGAAGFAAIRFLHEPAGRTAARHFMENR